MDIVTIYFAVLTIVSCFVYWLLSYKYRVIFLIGLSCVFIGSLSINLLCYVIIFALFNYSVALHLPDSKIKKSLFNIGIIINILQIVLLKYYDFTIGPLFDLFEIDSGLSRISQIIVPIGVSYFTLQGIGYLINVNMGWEKPERRVLNFILYIIFFPKFLSGPIERSNHFLPQLNTRQSFNLENASTGLRIALGGFFKKVIIANHLSGTVSQFYHNADDIGGLNYLLVLIVQPLYLYFDFSGYTDIAIGFSKMFGINLIPNFDKPFLSKNMTTFWRRFHISLSSWFNDYVFKQTSFKLRKLKSHATIIAVFITWILFGIWHGAGWNFMILGFLQAVAIYYEFLTRKKRAALFSRLPESLRVWTGRFFTYCFYGFSLTFFFSPDILTTTKVFSSVRNLSGFSNNGFLAEPLLFGLFFALMFLVYEVLQTDYTEIFKRCNLYWRQYRFIRIVTYYLAVIMILTQLSGGASFVYEMF